MSSIRFFLIFLLVLILCVPFMLLPLRLSMALGDALGRLAYLLLRSRRAVTVDGIRQSIATGAIESPKTAEDIARDSFCHLGISFAEIVKVYSGRGQKVMDSISIDGIENLRLALSYGKGVLFVTGHYGNWELLALYCARALRRIRVVARRQDNPFLNSFVERVREGFGNTVIYKEGALKNVLRELKSGGAVGILCDQSVIEREGVLVDFLGRPAWTMKMPIVISQKTGAPLLPTFMRRVPSGHRITFHAPFVPDREASLVNHLEHLNRFLEDQIREDPSQWLWMHRKWKRTTQKDKNEHSEYGQSQPKPPSS